MFWMPRVKARTRVSKQRELGGGFLTDDSRVKEKLNLSQCNYTESVSNY